MNLFTLKYSHTVIYTQAYTYLHNVTNLFTEVGLHVAQNVIEKQQSNTEPS